MRLGVCGRAAVVAEPGFVVVADAGADDQVVVVNEALCCQHTFLLALETGDFGLDVGVAEFVGSLQIAVGQVVAVDDVDQPLVAHRAREENRVALEHHHVEVRVVLLEVLGRTDAAPAATADDDAFLALDRRQQWVVLGVDEEGQRAGGLGYRSAGGKCTAGGEEVTTIEFHLVSLFSKPPGSGVFRV